jgi:hypothetical protein
MHTAITVRCGHAPKQWLTDGGLNAGASIYALGECRTAAVAPAQRACDLGVAF